MEFKDYYSILGVEPGAGDAEIKTAYRRLARKYHPDVSKEAGAEDKFKAIGEAFFALITSEEAISTHRMMMVPGNIDDRLKQTFWEAGPQRTHDAFAALLQALVAKGELDVPDVAIASVQFFTLIKGEVHARMTCGLCSQPGPLDRRRHIDATVDMFLRAYGRR